LLGTGFRAPLRPETLQVIRAMNSANRPVLALDIPSGLDADSGAADQEAVRAEITLSFVGFKTGLFLGAGPEHAGVVLLDDLGVVAPAHKEFVPVMRRIDEAEIAAALPPGHAMRTRARARACSFVGGGAGMPGAVRMAGIAALRVGAGLVTVAASAENLAAVSGAHPELIYLPVSSVTDLEETMRTAGVLAIGPGLGTGDWGPAPLGAGAARASSARGGRRRCTQPAGAESGDAATAWIITPHPGEAARLLASTTRAVQADRLAAVREMHARYGAVAVLKGAGTLVASGPRRGDRAAYLRSGNPGMATAGMGDVLTGVIAGLRAQGIDARWRARRRAGARLAAIRPRRAAARPDRQRRARELRGWVNP
jgi:NAD(P)H-hydrate epimerase